MVYGLVENMADFSVLNNIYAIVNIDDTKLTYSIEPLESINNINVTKLEENIEVNDKNTYKYQTIMDEDFSKEYMLSYKRLALGAPEMMYEKLNEEYRNKRFGSLEAFKQYVNENHDKIYSTALSTYLVEEKEGYKQYVLTDQKGNYYIFRETSPMEYTLILDTYTIDLPEFLEKYNNGDEKLKVKMNINRFVEAIKVNNYKYAYGKLDKNFKAQYFPTIAEFEQYVKTVFVYNEEIDYGEFSDIDGVYTYTVELKSGENVIGKTFAVELLEGTEYKLSFNIN